MLPPGRTVPTRFWRMPLGISSEPLERFFKIIPQRHCQAFAFTTPVQYTHYLGDFKHFPWRHNLEQQPPWEQNSLAGDQNERKQLQRGSAHNTVPKALEGSRPFCPPHPPPQGSTTFFLATLSIILPFSPVNLSPLTCRPLSRKTIKDSLSQGAL